MRYKIFGRRTGLRVSEFALGAGNFGTRWGHGAERAEAGLGVALWSPLGGGFLSGKYRQSNEGRINSILARLVHREKSEKETAILDTVMALAKEVGA